MKCRMCMMSCGCNAASTHQMEQPHFENHAKSAADLSDVCLLPCTRKTSHKSRLNDMRNTKGTEKGAPYQAVLPNQPAATAQVWHQTNRDEACNAYLVQVLQQVLQKGLEKVQGQGLCQEPTALREQGQQQALQHTSASSVTAALPLCIHH